MLAARRYSLCHDRPMRLGAYEILGELGRGSVGRVLKARGPDGRDVAIKLLLKSESRGALEHFGRERRLQAELGESQGFVPLLDAGEVAENPFIVMPFLPGGTLRDRLRRGPLAIDEA